MVVSTIDSRRDGVNVRRHGTESEVSMQDQSTIQRFWRHVKRGGNDECWEWTGYRNRNGYGRFGTGKRALGTFKLVIAHRFCYVLYYGEPTANKPRVLHHCDNPPCQNPRHLYAGTLSDNTQDSINRGRNYQRRKTHCPQGHPYTPENTYKYRGERQCIECRTARSQARRRT